MDLPAEPNHTEAVTAKHHKLKKIFPLLLLALLSTGLVLGIFLLDKSKGSKFQGIWMKVPIQNEKPTATLVPSPQPTKDPTLDWKTYMNNSFKIKYPQRFAITEVEIPYSTLYPKIYSSTVFSDLSSKISITTAKNTANFTLNTIAGNGPGIRYSKSILTSGSSDFTKINNYNALVTTRIPAGKDGIAKEVLIITGNKVYQLTLSPLDTDTAAFDKILDTFQVLNQEPSDITENWQVYTNNYYGYTIKFPTNFGIDHERNATISALTIIYDPNDTSTDAPKFKIEAQDIKNITLSNITSRSYLGLPLDEYVTKKWEYNKAGNSAVPDKTVSAVKETNVSGKTAYEFSVTGEYRDDRVSEKLSQEYQFYFTENKGYKLIIWKPKYDNLFNEILKTISFK